MDTSTVTLVVAGLAVVVGLGAAFELVRRRPREAARARHPSTGAPFAITLVRSGYGAHWSIAVAAGAPALSIDIVTYRPAGGSGAWQSEPIVAPIEIGPGGSAVLPSAIDDPAATHEVVVAWTAHRADGDVTGSGSFVVHPEHGIVTAPADVSSHAWVTAGLVLAMLLVTAGAVVAWELAGDGSSDAEAVSARPVAPDSTPPPTTAAPDTVASTTAPTAATTTTAAPTAATTTTTAAPTAATTTTTAPTTTAATTTTGPTTVPTGPAVLIEGRVEDCRYGAACLIAGFEIVRFDRQPVEYVCEFSDGSRTTFRFGGSGVETACSQAGANPSITIEVDGVRSETITR